MSGVAESDGRHAMRDRAVGGEIHRLLADDLAEAEATVDDQQRAAIVDDLDVLVRQHLARSNPIDIFANADDAMRIVPPRARLDEMVGDDAGLLRARAGGRENVSGEPPHGLLWDAKHFPLTGIRHRKLSRHIGTRRRTLSINPAPEDSHRSRSPFGPCSASE